MALMMIISDARGLSVLMLFLEKFMKPKAQKNAEIRNGMIGIFSHPKP